MVRRGVVGLSGMVTIEDGGAICHSNSGSVGIFDASCSGTSILGRTLGRSHMRRANLGVPGVLRIAAVSKG